MQDMNAETKLLEVKVEGFHSGRIHFISGSESFASQTSYHKRPPHLDTAFGLCRPAFFTRFASFREDDREDVQIPAGCTAEGPDGPPGRRSRPPADAQSLQPALQGSSCRLADRFNDCWEASTAFSFLLHVTEHEEDVLPQDSNSRTW